MSKIEIYNTKLKEKSIVESLPQIFDFKGKHVRIIRDEKGNPWFIASDVTEVLGYRMASDATRILDSNEKGTSNLRTLGGVQKLNTVNESGLYSLIFASRKEEAKKFKKWVTSDVLPTIRKTGGYGQQVDLSDPKLLHQLVLDYTNRVMALEDKLASNQPKVSFYDDFINSDGLYNLQNAARALNLHPNLFIDSLKSDYLFYQGSALVPHQRYRTQGLFIVKSNVINNNIRYQTYITPKGLLYFAEHNYTKQANGSSAKYLSNYQSTLFNN